MARIEFREVAKRFGRDVIAVDSLTLDVDDGEFVILVGPSGCGKTTALRMTAGLEEVTSGEILIGGRLVNDRPPTERDVAMVFQNYALYPHMTVRDNIAFPLRQQRVKRREIESRVRDAARVLAIEPLLDRRPRELSGGQRQRVAIGRALVRRPQAFLMDEPLSNLDAKLRVQMRAELLSLHRRLGITTIYVTHDQTEAMTLGDRVVVLDRGVVQQIDAPERLYRHPRNTFVASFIGSPSMNFLDAALDDGGLVLGGRRFELPPALRDGGASGRGSAVVVGIRPEDVRPVDASSADGFDGEVVITEQLGPEVLAYVRVDGLTAASSPAAQDGEREESADLQGTLVARLPGEASIRAGDRLRVLPALERLNLFDAGTGEALVAAAPATA
jgi:multiple sugar transport system ATP-binding protein